MGRDITDAIDDCCEEITGHTNWAFQDAVPKLEMLNHQQNNNIRCVVVFFKKPVVEEE